MFRLHGTRADERMNSTKTENENIFKDSGQLTTFIQQSASKMCTYLHFQLGEELGGHYEVKL